MFKAIATAFSVAGFVLLLAEHAAASTWVAAWSGPEFNVSIGYDNDTSFQYFSYPDDPILFWYGNGPFTGVLTTGSDTKSVDNLSIGLGHGTTFAFGFDQSPFLTDTSNPVYIGPDSIPAYATYSVENVWDLATGIGVYAPSPFIAVDYTGLNGYANLAHQLRIDYFPMYGPHYNNHLLAFEGYNFQFTVTEFSIREISAAPEPSAWVLFIIGIGGVGAMVRLVRKRDKKCCFSQS